MHTNYIFYLKNLPFFLPLEISSKLNKAWETCDHLFICFFSWSHLHFVCSSPHIIYPGPSGWILLSTALYRSSESVKSRGLHSCLTAICSQKHCEVMSVCSRPASCQEMQAPGCERGCGPAKSIHHRAGAVKERQAVFTCD